MTLNAFNPWVRKYARPSNLLLIMKLTTFILFVALAQVSAKSTAQKVNIIVDNMPLEKVLESIQKQSGYDFIFNSKDINGLKVSLKINNLTVAEAVSKSIKDLPLSFKIIRKNIVLTSLNKSVSLDEQKETLIDSLKIKVEGQVIDSTGTPVQGARVSILKGGNLTGPTSLSLFTSDQGMFKVTANVGDIIKISSLSYQDAFILVKKEIIFQKVRLNPLITKLNEVVIQTGYQKLSRERTTGSYSKPDMKILSNRNGSMDLIRRLDGLVPGLALSPNALTVTDNGDGPVSRRAKALIRGTSSVSLPTEPLYVLNGVIISDFRSLNLDDVEDITVLKDAAAAAIWGAQAANGVIVLTTKAGNRNQKLKISYNGFVDIKGKPDLDYQRFMNSSQIITAGKQIFNPVNKPYSTLYNSFVSPLEEILYSQYAKYGNTTTLDAGATKSLDSLSSIDNREQIKDLFYRNAYTNNHTLSASGGSNAYNFYSSFGYTSDIDNMPGNKFDTYRWNLSQNLNLGKRIFLGLNASLSQSVNQSKGYALVTNAFLPYQLFVDENDNYINMPYIQGRTAAQRNIYQSASGIDLNTYNPFDDRTKSFSTNKVITANLTADATVKLWKGLSFKGTYGYLTSPGTSLNYEDVSSYGYRQQLLNLTLPASGNNGPTYLIPNYGGTMNSRNRNQRSWTVRNQLAYELSGRDGNDQLNLQVGQEAREQFSSANSTMLMGYDLNLQTYAVLDYATLSKGNSQTVTGYGSLSQKPFTISESMSRFSSYYALASYTFNHKYSLDGSWRVDHSNLFGSDVSAQNKPVWSAGIKWNVTEEKFVKTLNWLNNLSLRATYGLTGNSPYVGYATTYDILSQEQFTPYPLLAGKSYIINSPANRKLSWETTYTTNMGLDFSALGNRIFGTLEYYHKNTTSLLGNVPFNPFVGFSSGTSNVGKLRNNGINISLNAINIKSSDFEWATGFVFSYNKNKLLDYVPVTGDDSSNKLYLSYVTGYPMSSMFAYKYAGLDNRGYPQIQLADGTVTAKTNVASGKDLVYKGSLIPIYTGGISNNFKYKNFELSVNLVYQLGAVMRRDVNNFYSGRFLEYGGSFLGNISPDFEDRWMKPGDELKTNIPGYLPVEDYGGRTLSYYTQGDINVVSASYVKLRDAMLSYNLDSRVLSFLKVQSIILKAQISNILLWKANKFGIDPEFQDPGNGTRGIPINQHAINFGVNVNF